MSQSDYLKSKRISTQLRIDNQIDAGMTATNQPPLFTSNDLQNYKQYALTNTIVNTKPTLNRLTPKLRQRVYDMDKVVSGCPSFIVCKDTQNRNNHVLSSAGYFGATTANNTAKSSLVNIRTYWDNEPANLKTECNCAVGNRTTDNYACACSVGRFGIVR
jgi:hypothetical protein